MPQTAKPIPSGSTRTSKPAPTQSTRLIEVFTPLGDDVLLLRSARFTEELSTPFSCDLELASAEDQLDLDALLGRPLTVRIELAADVDRFLNGYVSRLVQLTSQDGLARYHASVVPWLWFLSRTSDCRIFQNESVPQIVTRVFRDHGFADFELRLSSHYEIRDYTTQYRETALDFVCRLLEQEGIAFYFEHTQDKHVLVLVDGPSAHRSFPGFDQIECSLGDVKPRHIYDWTLSKELQSGRYSLVAFDFEVPRKDLHVRSVPAEPPEHANGTLERFDSSDEYTTREHGEATARKRIEELQARYEIVNGRANTLGLATGHTYQVSGHPRDDQNREYLVTRATCFVQSNAFASTPGETGTLECDTQFVAIPADTHYRPPRCKPRPIVQGPQTAIVTGPEGEEIWTDEYGRVKVCFHWDRQPLGGTSTSCFIRVSQALAGNKWGAMFSPRVGQEVIVEFLDGNPDKPLVTGCVYNGTHAPPYELPENKTVSGIKSNSTRDGDGYNEIRMQDENGAEQLYIHAQKDFDLRVENDRYETVSRDRHLTVVRDQKSHIQVDRHETIGRDLQERIGRDQHTQVRGKQAIHVSSSRSIVVGGDVAQISKRSRYEEVGEHFTLRSMDAVIESLTGITLKCGPSSIVLDPLGVTITGPMVVVDGSMTRINSGPGAPPLEASEIRPVGPVAPEAVIGADTGNAGSRGALIPKRPGADDVEPTGDDDPHVPSDDDIVDPTKTWIEIELIDDDGEPIAGEPYAIELPDGSLATGTTDVDGIARVEGFDPGQCKLTFPRLDEDAWREV